jgi:tetratricopeptide (TPR) repeat protein
MKPRNQIILAAAVLFLALFAILAGLHNGKFGFSNDGTDPRHSAKRSGGADAVADHKGNLRVRRERQKSPQDFTSFAKKVRTDNDFPKLSAEQLEIYLNSAGRSAASLLTAFHLSKDEAYLEEALESFPQEPQVLLEAARRKDAATALELLQRLKKEDPENGLADFLSARSLFDMGRNEEALAHLLQSTGKPFNDFTSSTLETGEGLYVSAGRLPAEAKLISMCFLSRFDTMRGREMAVKLGELREQYEAAGDLQSAENMIKTQLELARQIGQGPFVIDHMVSNSIEKILWKGDDSPEAAEAQAEIVSRQTLLRDKALKVGTMMESSAVPESDWVNYMDRVKQFGEAAANDWILEKHPNP